MRTLSQQREPITVRPEADRSEAVRLIQHYDLDSLPVIDADGVLLGTVTVDDVMDVAEEESTEDFHRLASVGTVDVNIRDAGIWYLFRRRAPWLVLLVFANIFSGAALAHYEDTIASALVLLFFLPLLIGSAGNAGSQSSTLMVRALATGDVSMRDWFSLLLKEFGVALALGLALALAVAGLGIWRGGPAIGLTVALTMVVAVMAGSLIGMSLPFAFSKLKLDPATASTPLITLHRRHQRHRHLLWHCQPDPGPLKPAAGGPAAVAGRRHLRFVRFPATGPDPTAARAAIDDPC